uniref:Uncharacterized protein n=1 Tax=Anopheles farauti TaxID=69004 RepID=A0A182QVI0_9DIPT
MVMENPKVAPAAEVTTLANPSATRKVEWKMKTIFIIIMITINISLSFIIGNGSAGPKNAIERTRTQQPVPDEDEEAPNPASLRRLNKSRSEATPSVDGLRRDASYVRERFLGGNCADESPGTAKPICPRA